MRTSTAPPASRLACAVTRPVASKSGTAHQVTVKASGAALTKTPPPAEGSRSAKKGATRGTPVRTRPSDRAVGGHVAVAEGQVAVGVDEGRGAGGAVEREGEGERLLARVVVGEAQAPAEVGPEARGRAPHVVAALAVRLEADRGAAEIEGVGAEHERAVVGEHGDVAGAHGRGARRAGADPAVPGQPVEGQEVARVAVVVAEAVRLRRARAGGASPRRSAASAAVHGFPADGKAVVGAGVGPADGEPPEPPHAGRRPARRPDARTGASAAERTVSPPGRPRLRRRRGRPGGRRSSPGPRRRRGRCSASTSSFVWMPSAITVAPRPPPMSRMAFTTCWLTFFWCTSRTRAMSIFR